MRQLDSEDPAERIAAAGKLVDLRSARAIPKLIELVERDTSEGVLPSRTR